jgi:hypothetical protein
MKLAANTQNASDNFDTQLLNALSLNASSIQNELQIVNIWLQTLEPALSGLIRIVEQSAKLLHLQGATDLASFKDTKSLVPLRVPSGPEGVDTKLLTRTHMAYLLAESLFKGQELDQIE